MSHKSFTQQCTACQSKTTVVYKPLFEVVMGWGTDMIPRDPSTFVCAVCKKPLLTKALEGESEKAPTKAEPAVPTPAPQVPGLGWGSDARTKRRGTGWS